MDESVDLPGLRAQLEEFLEEKGLASGSAAIAGEKGFTKHDAGKPRMDLIEPDFLLGLAVVLTQGAAEHGDRNWQLAVDDWKAGRDRYVAALGRHWLDLLRLKQADKDSGQHPAAHVAACAMFIQWMDEWAANKGHQ